MNVNDKKAFRYLLCAVLLVCCLMVSACSSSKAGPETDSTESQTSTSAETSTSEKNTAATESISAEERYSIDVNAIPAFSGTPYFEVNSNIPIFDRTEKTTEAFEHYSSLDRLGRCGVAFVNVCKAIMPTVEQGDNSEVIPKGWNDAAYDFIDGSALYYRSQLIDFQLSGENANIKNLITGTRYLDIEGMQPFENKVAEYVQGTNKHVLYRVTPIYNGDNLVASGVLMEAQSVEDNGKDLSYCVYCYNAQPGVAIDYATGSSSADGTIASPAAEAAPETAPAEEAAPETNVQQPAQTTPVHDYVLNTSTRKFHLPKCGTIKNMKDANKQLYTGSREDLINQGYSPCEKCDP